MRIGIIGAMEEEIIKLRSLMRDEEVTKKAGMKFSHGELYGKDVVVVKSGIGKVNAAICAQILIDDYKVDRIINTGVAGALYSKLNIGDIVLSSDAMYHDFDVTGFGYLEGVIPRMETSIFPADKDFVEKAREVCEKVNKDINVYIGRIVSGDQFISAPDKKQELVEKFEGYCAEMEGAAIAHVAYLNRIPFFVMRAISDKADGSATSDYRVFEISAIEHTMLLIEELLREI